MGRNNKKNKQKKKQSPSAGLQTEDEAHMLMAATTTFANPTEDEAAHMLIAAATTFANPTHATTEHDNEVTKKLASVHKQVLSSRVRGVDGRALLDAFLQNEGKRVFHLVLDPIRAIRSRLEIAHDLEQVNTLIGIYEHLSMLWVASPHALDQHVMESDLREYLVHCKEVLQGIAKDPNWINKGIPAGHNKAIFGALKCFINPRAVKICIEEGVMSALAQAWGAHPPGKLPSQTLTELFIRLTSLGMKALVEGDSSWDDHKEIRCLESTGLLAQLFRCFTTRHQCRDDLRRDDLQDSVIRSISQDPGFIKKKLLPGCHTGRVLVDVVNKRDGFLGERDAVTQGQLETIARMAQILNEDKKVQKTSKCNQCGSEYESGKLMACSRCHFAFYCSRECQRAAWPKHKKECSPMPSGVRALIDMHTKPNPDRDFSKAALRRIFTESYHLLMKEIYRVVRRLTPRGFVCTSMCDVLLELDLKIDPKTGRAPALEKPPKFRICPISGYIEGSRPNEPDWFEKKTSPPERYEHTVRSFIAGIEKYRGTGHLLMMCRFPSGVVQQEPLYDDDSDDSSDDKVDRFSDEAFCAYAFFQDTNDHRCLKAYFDKKTAELLLSNQY